jgi:hypothetical protein
MKNLSLAFTLLYAFSICTHGQTAVQKQAAEREQSNIEKFSEKSGTLFERKFIDVGVVKSVKVQVMIITDMMSSAKISGVRFELEKAGQYSRSTKIAFLDKDEVDGLIKSLALLKSSVLTSTRDSYTEVEFKSRSGFSAGATFMKLERFDSDSYAFLKPEDFDALTTLLQQAKSQLI